MAKTKLTRRTRIRRSIRRKIQGVPARPRLSVFKSNTAIYAQLIDDIAGVTLAHSTSQKKGTLSAKLAFEVGQDLASKAENVKQVVFDRGGWRYHGHIKALAEGARKGGLIF